MDPLTELETALDLDLRSSARALGRWALEHEAALLERLRHGEPLRQVKAFATKAAQPHQLVKAVGDGSLSVRSYRDRLASQLELVVDDELKPLAFLRALCLGPLASWFDFFDKTVMLERGDPFPYATRPLGPRRPAMTPFITTPLIETLLPGTTFGLYRREPARPLHVVLDYRHRTLVDRHTWTSDADLDEDDPSRSWGPVPMATINPYADFDDDVDWTPGAHDWFWVRPRRFDEAGILDQLAEAAAHPDGPAAIAVLPELSLPEPGALGPALRENPERYPAVTVAGSAHEEVDGRRANVSCTYIDGAEVLRHHKHQGLHLRRNGTDYPEGLSEPAGVLTVVAGASARLAVVICADLMNDDVKECLESCGVNLLLVPAMTPGVGGFKGPLAGVASRNQGVSLISNTVAPPLASPQHQFLAYLGLPVQDPSRSDEIYPGPKTVKEWKGWLLVKAWCNDVEERYTWYPAS
jgi:hypothetical protein